MVADMTIAVEDIKRAGERAGTVRGERKGNCLRASCWICVMALIISNTLTTDVVAQQARTGPFSGKDLQEQLKRPITLSWSSAELGNSLRNLANTRRIAIFLDRRVDPNRPVEFTAENVPLGEVLYQIAEQADCGVYWMGDVAWIGPLQQVAELGVVHTQLLEQVNQLEENLRRRLLSSRAWSIPRLSHPGELLQRELEELDMPCDGDLPHDVWADTTLPPMRVVERLIMLVYGFDLWIEFAEAQNGPGLRLARVPSPAEGELRYRVATRNRRSTMEQLAGRFPDVSIVERGNMLVARGSAMQLYELRKYYDSLQFASSPGAGNPRQGTLIVSGRIANSLENILKAAADKLQVELQYDPALREALIERVDITVSGVTWEELVDRVLRNTELEYELDDDRLLIRDRDR